MVKNVLNPSVVVEIAFPQEQRAMEDNYRWCDQLANVDRDSDVALGQGLWMSLVSPIHCFLMVFINWLK